jgi:hypothetical protein
VQVTAEQVQAGMHVGVIVSSFDDMLVRGSLDQRLHAPPHPTDLACICYTSGTTGLALIVDWLLKCLLRRLFVPLTLLLNHLKSNNQYPGTRVFV